MPAASIRFLPPRVVALGARSLLCFLCVACLPQRAAAQTSVSHPPRSIADVLATITQAKPDDQAREANRALLAAPTPTDATPSALRLHHQARGWAAYELGDIQREIEEFTRALAVAETIGGNELIESLQALSNSHAHSGSYVLGLSLRERLAALPMTPARRVAVLGGIVPRYVRMRDLPAARRAADATAAAFEEASRSPHSELSADMWASSLHYARASVQGHDGEWDKADASYRAAIAAAERAQSAASQSVNQTPQGSAGERNVTARNSDLYERIYARFLIRQERYLEAETVLRRQVARQIARLGARHVETAHSLGLFAELALHAGRFADAAELGRAVVKLYDDMQVTRSHIRRDESARIVGRALAAQGDFAGALIAFERAESDMAAERGRFGSLARIELDWILALIMEGQPARAVGLLAPEIARLEDRFGADELSANLLRTAYELARARSGDTAAAVGRLLELVPKVLESSASGARSAITAVQVRRVLELYAGIIMSLPIDQLPKDVDPAAEAFRAAEGARANTTQGAVTRAALRFAATDPAIAALMRREQDLERELEDLNDYMQSLAYMPPEQRMQISLADTQQRARAVREERTAIRATLAERFPRYAALIQPVAPGIQEVRARLGPDEVFLAIATLDRETLVWAFGKTGEVQRHRVALGRKALLDRANTLRESFVMDAQGGLKPYDFALAHQLYRDLLAPVAGAWADAGKIVVAVSGPLLQLPLSVLVTDVRPLVRKLRPLYSEYSQAAWLGTRVAFTYVPSAGSYVQLRSVPAGSPRRRAFAGFGDPQFNVGSAAARSPEISPVRNGGFLRKDASPDQWPTYGQLAPLPETRAEILAIAKALGADQEKDVFLGQAATLAQVRRAQLGDRKVLMFATHGLVPGDLPGLDQPALALAPEAGGEGSPLLRLEDVLALKLDSDLVVLSACNTAAGDGAGAEALSGLGRGFFYAGSRALVLTHWPVETESARDLTVSFFERKGRSGGLSFATALKDAMTDLMRRGTREVSYAHPMFWAPFVLVGDG
ncbi:MAG: CHAT domain-containing protein [Betaproteobacteria bacterium]|nr:CHAT domain-containing protein [Betaproteobacteria bacterium]